MVNHRSFGVHRGRIYANVGSFVSQNIPHCAPLAVKRTFHRYLSLTKSKNRSPPVVWNKCPFFLCFTHWSTHVWIYRDYCHCYTRHTRCHSVSFERYTLPLHAYVLPNAVPHSPLFLQYIHLTCRGLSTCCYKLRHISLTVSRSKLVPPSFDAYWTTEHDCV